MEKRLRDTLPEGVFQGVSEKRSKTMSAIRSSNNKSTELRLRLGLVRARFRGWKLNYRGLKGTPDIYFPESGLVIFADGCFWHGCDRCGHVPKSNKNYWTTKIERNRERDRETTSYLVANGYKVLRFWEHELTNNLDDCIASIRAALQ